MSKTDNETKLLLKNLSGKRNRKIHLPWEKLIK